MFVVGRISFCSTIWAEVRRYISGRGTVAAVDEGLPYVKVRTRLRVEPSRTRISFTRTPTLTGTVVPPTDRLPPVRAPSYVHPVRAPSWFASVSIM